MDEDKARDAVEHLQTAVSELIAAGRAILDALEDSFGPSEAGPTLSKLVDSFARGFIPPATDDDHDHDDEDGGDDGDYEHIPVE
jgi:hypothetical protein